VGRRFARRGFVPAAEAFGEVFGEVFGEAFDAFECMHAHGEGA
jgi:hypothetical protein